MPRKKKKSCSRSKMQDELKKAEEKLNAEKKDLEEKDYWQKFLEQVNKNIFDLSNFENLLDKGKLEELGENLSKVLNCNGNIVDSLKPVLNSVEELSKPFESLTSVFNEVKDNWSKLDFPKKIDANMGISFLTAGLGLAISAFTSKKPLFEGANILSIGCSLVGSLFAKDSILSTSMKENVDNCVNSVNKICKAVDGSTPKDVKDNFGDLVHESSKILQNIGNLFSFGVNRLSEPKKESSQDNSLKSKGNKNKK